MSQTALIGLGSSLGDRLRSLRLAAALLEGWSGIHAESRSRVYLSCPLGPARHSFLNAVLRLRCEQSGPDLLEICKVIEFRLGRASSGRWMDRVIDLDILLLGPQNFRSPDLQLPHPGLLDRSFAMVPAVEIAGEMIHPVVERPLRECPIPGPFGLRLWGCL